MKKALSFLVVFFQMIPLTDVYLAVNFDDTFLGLGGINRQLMKKKEMKTRGLVLQKENKFPFGEEVHELYAEHELFETQLKSYIPKEMRHIVVVIPSYNNAEHYKRNLSSVFEQDYKGKFSIIYVDDASPDCTGDLCEAYIKEKKQEHRTILIKNAKNNGAMANWYNAIHGCDPQSVVVNLDGDDCLAKKSVLSLINKIYDKYNVLLTYGSYQVFPYITGAFTCSRPIPAHFSCARAYRKMKVFALSHLRTYKASLFQAIAKEDLMLDGSFFDTSCDLAMMYPMAEMAGSRIIYIPDVLYIYNLATSLNDHKIRRARQRLCGQVLRQRPVYPIVDMK